MAGTPRGAFWTPEKLEKAKRLYLGGMTSEEVAACIGATKGQVVGKVHSLGWQRTRVGPRRTPEHGGAWSEERVEKVRALWFEGKSAGEIRRIVSEVHWKPTRNTILGKVTRMGWAAMRDKRASPPKKAPKPATRAPSPPRVIFSAKTGLPVGEAAKPTRVKPTGPVAGSQPKHWTERRRGECCWPVSGEGADTFSCCAVASVQTAGGGYCAAHNRVRTAPAQSNLLRSLRRHFA